MAIRLEIIEELVKSNVSKAEVDADVLIFSPGDLPMEWRVEFEERAAILEYDGGLNRKMADVQALKEILQRIKGTQNR